LVEGGLELVSVTGESSSGFDVGAVSVEGRDAAGDAVAWRESIPEELRRLMTVWPGLPEDVKRRILELAGMTRAAR